MLCPSRWQKCYVDVYTVITGKTFASKAGARHMSYLLAFAGNLQVETYLKTIKVAALSGVTCSGCTNDGKIGAGEYHMPMSQNICPLAWICFSVIRSATNCSANRDCLDQGPRDHVITS